MPKVNLSGLNVEGLMELRRCLKTRGVLCPDQPASRWFRCKGDVVVNNAACSPRCIEIESRDSDRDQSRPVPLYEKRDAIAIVDEGYDHGHNHYSTWH